MNTEEVEYPSFTREYRKAQEDERYDTYSVTYNLEGSRWAIEIPARSQEDAMQRLTLAATYGEVVGPCYMVPVRGPVGGLIARFLCLLRNVFKSSL